MPELNERAGPLYGIALIDTLPWGAGPMVQAMPSRNDLLFVARVNERTVAGYEVLLSHHYKMQAVLEALTLGIARIEGTEFCFDGLRYGARDGNWAGVVDVIGFSKLQAAIDAAKRPPS